MHTNASEHKRLTRTIEMVRQEVHRECVTHWTPAQIAQAFPDGYPESQLRKGRQSCEASVRDESL